MSKDNVFTYEPKMKANLELIVDIMHCDCDYVVYKDKQISDLEAKLAEAQKTIEIQKMSNDALKEDNIDRSYDIVDLAFERAKDIAEDWEFGYKEEIKELKQQLAESEEKCNKQWLQIQADTEHIQRLEQQLEEKEKEIEYYKSWFADDDYEKHNQDKISFCIKKLEWVQKLLLDNAFNDLSVVLGEIDNQIEQLTHQHEDKGE